MKKQNVNRALSLLLVLAMLCGLLCTTAFAATTDGAASRAYAGDGSTDNPYLVLVEDTNLAFTPPSQFWSSTVDGTPQVGNFKVVFEGREGNTQDGALIYSLGFDMANDKVTTLDPDTGKGPWDGDWTYAFRLAYWTQFDTSTGDLRIAFPWKGEFAFYFNSWTYTFDAVGLTADLAEDKQLAPGDSVEVTYYGGYLEGQTSRGLDYTVDFTTADDAYPFSTTAVVDEDGFVTLTGDASLPCGGNYIVTKVEPEPAIPYTINTVADWLKFAETVNGGYSYAGETVTLAADLDFTGCTDWVPVGSSNTFQGTFDGQNHTISNLAMSQAGASYGGLFGYVTGATAAVKNLTLEDVTYTEGTSTVPVGLVVGSFYGKELSNITVRNSTIDIDGTSGTVGLVAGQILPLNGPTVSKITVAGCTLLADSTFTGYFYAGGILGCVNGNVAFPVDQVAVTGLTMEITHKGQGMIGGIIGGNAGLTSAIAYTDCTVEGAITVTSTAATLTNATDVVGGLQGKSQPNGVLTATNCHVALDITGTKVAEIGGLVGYCTGGAVLNGCSFTGSISSDSYRVGGVVGYYNNSNNNALNVYNCIINADLSGSTDVGGIAGRSECSAAHTYSGNMILGTITATADTGYAGGLTGYVTSDANAGKLTYTNNAILVESITGGADTVGLLIPTAAPVAANEGNAVLDITTTNASETASSTFIAPSAAAIPVADVLKASAYAGTLGNVEDSPLTIVDGYLPYLNATIDVPDYMNVAPVYTVTLAPSAETIHTGDTVTVDVKVTGAAFSDYDITVTYDPDLFTYGNTNTGSIEIVGYDKTNASGDVIATLSFKAVDSLSTTTTGSFGFSRAKVGVTIDALENDAENAAQVGAAVAVVPTFTVTFADKNGVTLDTVTVDDNGTVAAENIPVAPAVAHYDFAGWALNGTVVDVTATPVTGDVTYTAAYTATPYTVDFDDAEISAPATATIDQDYTGTVLNIDSNYTYSVIAALENGTEETYAVGSDGSFTIPAGVITGSVSLTVTASLNGVTAAVFEDYAGGYSLIVVYGISETGYVYHGNAMYRTSQYDADTDADDYAYAIIVAGSVEAEDVLANLTVAATAAADATASYDVNNTGLVDINDAQAVADCYNVAADLAQYMAVYLRADVDGSHEVDSTDASLVLDNRA